MESSVFGLCLFPLRRKPDVVTLALFSCCDIIVHSETHHLLRASLNHTRTVSSGLTPPPPTCAPKTSNINGCDSPDGPHYKLGLVKPPNCSRENYAAPSLLVTGDRDPFLGPRRAPGPLGIPTFNHNPVHVRKLESGPAGTDDGHRRRC